MMSESELLTSVSNTDSGQTSVVETDCDFSNVYMKADPSVSTDSYASSGFKSSPVKRKQPEQDNNSFCQETFPDAKICKLDSKCSYEICKADKELHFPGEASLNSSQEISSSNIGSLDMNFSHSCGNFSVNPSEEIRNSEEICNRDIFCIPLRPERNSVADVSGMDSCQDVKSSEVQYNFKCDNLHKLENDLKETVTGNDELVQNNVASTSNNANSSKEQSKKYGASGMNEKEISEIIDGLDNEINTMLEETAEKNQLTATNVKSILRHVITNEYVLAMVRNTMKLDGDAEGELEDAVYEPKLTRSKAKELREKQASLPWPVSSPAKQNVKKISKKLLEEEFSEEDNSSDEEYQPNEEEAKYLFACKMYPTRQGLECPAYARLVPKKTTKSPAWSYYGLPVTETGELVNPDLAICKICKCPVASKGGSTSNLFSHLKCHHPVEYTSLNTTNRWTDFVATIGQADNSSVGDENPSVVEINSAASVPPKKKQKSLLDFQPISCSTEKQCTAALTEFIATTMQPYSIVESEPFKKMVKTLNPRYKLPGQKFFSQSAVPKLFNEIKDKIKRELAIVKSDDMSVTTDCWTSIANVPFISVTAHFLDSQWKLKAACLSCTHLDDDHSAENIGEILTDILSHWDLDINLLFSCTTDNSANILKAMSFLKVRHIPCFGHTINIGINKALDIPVVQRAVAKVKKLQNTITHSWKMSRDLAKAQERLQMKVVKLPSACRTWWWSTLKLLNRFLQNQLPLCELLQDYPAKKHLMLEAKEISSLEDFVATTKLMEDVTRNLSGEDYTTASSVLPILMKIKKNLDPKEADKPLVKEIKNEILSPLTERYFRNDELMSMLMLATLCDPRFRLFYVNNKDEIKKLALSRMTDMYNSNEGMFEDKISEKKEKCSLAKLLDSDDDDDKIEENDFLPFKKAEKELKRYLTMSKVQLDEDPLLWWKSHEHLFPTLKVLARKYLAIQGTSVPSEEVFSTNGGMINKNRRSLLPKNAEIQVFLSQNKNFV